jgi:hypothetical protein
MNEGFNSVLNPQDFRFSDKRSKVPDYMINANEHRQSGRAPQSKGATYGANNHASGGCDRIVSDLGRQRAPAY